MQEPDARYKRIALSSYLEYRKQISDIRIQNTKSFRSSLLRKLKSRKREVLNIRIVQRICEQPPAPRYSANFRCQMQSTGVHHSKYKLAQENEDQPS